MVRFCLSTNTMFNLVLQIGNCFEWLVITQLDSDLYQMHLTVTLAYG